MMDAVLQRFAKSRRWMLTVRDDDASPVIHLGVSEGKVPDGVTLQSLRQHKPTHQLEVWVYPAEEFESLWQNWLENSMNSTAASLPGLEDGGGSWDGLMSTLSQDTTDLLSPESEGPMIRLLNSILSEALKLETSDIHCIPQENGTQIAFRCDGQLHIRHQLPRHFHAALCARIKVMSHLDVAETRQPQDGRMSVRIGTLTTDVRVSSVPTAHGERIVMRLLYRQRLLTLKELGMPALVEQRFEELIQHPHGLVLVTGPTGSGKTTTLYAALDHLRSGSENIITVEDPVEYRLEGISQIPVHPAIGFNFPDALRSILRQDPDIIMIGEIRDRETAQIAIQASLTGHLVLATLHTNDAPSAITRLLDMGVEPFLLSSTLRGVMAQRLIRRLCPSCKTPIEYKDASSLPRGASIPAHKLVPGSIYYEAVGCSACNNFGYKGRTGIYEALVITPALQQCMQNGAAEQSLRAEIERSDHASLFDDGLRWVNAGATSLTEVCRIALTTME
jgi:general secretion pathway protein E